MTFAPELVVLLRLFKLLAVMALAAGTLGAYLPLGHVDRQRAVYWIAGPAWGVAMVLGFLLAFARGTSLLSTWVLASLVLAIVHVQVLLFAVGTEHRRTVRGASLAIGLLIAIVVLMVYQPA